MRHVTTPLVSSDSTSGSSRSTRTRRGPRQHRVDQRGDVRAPGSPARTPAHCPGSPSRSRPRPRRGRGGGWGSARCRESAGHGYGGEDAVEHAIGGSAFELDLRPQHHPVPQRGFHHGLHLIRRDEVSTGQPRPRLGRMQQRRWRREATRPTRATGSHGWLAPTRRCSPARVPRRECAVSRRELRPGR